MQRIKQGLLYSDYLLGAAIIICQLFGQSELTSIFFVVTFFASAIIWIYTLTERITNLDVLAIFILITAFMSVTLNGMLSGFSPSFAYYKKYIMFCCTILFFSAAAKIERKDKFALFLEYLYIGIGIFLMFMYITQNKKMHILNGLYTNYLTFRFTNPNLTALFLSCMIMFLITMFFDEKNKARKVVLLIAAIVEMVFLCQTLSRNSLLAVAIFLCLSIIFVITKKQLRLKKWFLALSAVAPLIFVVVYMQIINAQTLTKIFSFMIGEGKGLDSRAFIWGNAIDELMSSPIMGAYYQISNGTGMSQLHNTHIDILVSYGVLTFILVCIFLYKLMESVLSNDDCGMNTMMLIGFICVLFLGMGEAAVFSGGMGIYLFAGVFLIVKKPNLAINACNMQIGSDADDSTFPNGMADD